MVLSLWAMVNTVRSANSRRIVCWMSSSVSKSTAAVASSRTKILLLRSSARAKHTNWRWPTLWSTASMNNLFFTCNKVKKEKVRQVNHLKFSPPSAIVYWSPSLSPETKFFRWLTSNTCHSWSSVYLLKGSKLSRRLPENSTGSCCNIHAKNQKDYVTKK